MASATSPVNIPLTWLRIIYPMQYNLAHQHKITDTTAPLADGMVRFFFKHPVLHGFLVLLCHCAPYSHPIQTLTFSESRLVLKPGIHLLDTGLPVRTDVRITIATQT